MKNQSTAKAKASMTKRTKKASAPSAADTFRAPTDEDSAKKVAQVVVYLTRDERKAFKLLSLERDESMASLARQWILEHLN